MRAYELTDDMIDEAMVWSESNLACFIPSEGKGTSITLYKAWNPMKFALIEADYEAIEDSILGFIELYDRNIDKGSVYSVGKVGATKGYGPLLYYMAMTLHTWLAPHAYHISKEAMAVWKKFFNMNTKRKLLNSGLDEENPLSYAYGLDPQTRVKVRNTLRQTQGLHNSFMNLVESEGSYTPDNLETMLWESASVNYLNKKLKAVY